MKIIVDANIIFSGILNLNSKIGDLLINSQKHFDFIAPEFLKEEIRSKYGKLCKITGLEIDDVIYLENFLYKQINFIPEKNIAAEQWDFAYMITKDIDPKDILYVAYASAFKCRLWSGDKKLLNGLKAANFEQIITSDELIELRNNLSQKSV